MPSIRIDFYAGPNGTLSGQTTQQVYSGNPATPVTAVPNAGYQFVNWTGSVTSNENPLTIQGIPSQNLTITANFAPITFSVNFSAGPGGAVSGALNQTVNMGADASAVTAVPDVGYRFTGWTGAVTGSANPLTVGNVTENMAVQANFELDVATVTFDVAGPGGTVSGDLDQVVSTGGNTNAVTAIPDLNYTFERWQGDHAGMENPLIITNVQLEMNIQAKFRCLMQVVESI